MEYIKRYVLSIAAIMLCGAVVESVMPSEMFKKYIKTVFGLVVLVTLINPFLNFGSFGNFFENYTFDGNFADYSAEEVYAEENINEIIKNEFEKNLCNTVRDDIKSSLLKECYISAVFADGKISYFSVRCEDGDFDVINEYVFEKYGLKCEKNQNTGY